MLGSGSLRLSGEVLPGCWSDVDLADSEERPDDSSCGVAGLGLGAGGGVGGGVREGRGDLCVISARARRARIHEAGERGAQRAAQAGGGDAPRPGTSPPMRCSR